jgi:hypothetical protein
VFPVWCVSRLERELEGKRVIQRLSELGVFFFWLGKAFTTSLQPAAAAASSSFCTLNKRQSWIRGRPLGCTVWSEAAFYWVVDDATVKLQTPWNQTHHCHFLILIPIVASIRWFGSWVGCKQSCYCPRANGPTCVDFGCTHTIDGLFWNLPIYLLGFFSKYECWVTDLIMSLYHFNFFELSLVFLYHKVSHHYEM